MSSKAGYPLPVHSCLTRRNRWILAAAFVVYISHVCLSGEKQQWIGEAGAWALLHVTLLWARHGLRTGEDPNPVIWGQLIRRLSLALVPYGALLLPLGLLDSTVVASALVVYLILLFTFLFLYLWKPEYAGPLQVERKKAGTLFLLGSQRLRWVWSILKCSALGFGSFLWLVSLLAFLSVAFLPGETGSHSGVIFFGALVVLLTYLLGYEFAYFRIDVSHVRVDRAGLHMGSNKSARWLCRCPYFFEVSREDVLAVQVRGNELLLETPKGRTKMGLPAFVSKDREREIERSIKEALKSGAA